MRINNKAHWEKVYSLNSDQDVGWYQEKPGTSLNLILRYSEIDSAIIDIGAGNANLANELLKAGYADLTVIDISSHAIERSKSKITSGIEKINFLETSVLELKPEKEFEIWHDRAVFHFLWDENEISMYVRNAVSHIASGGYLIIGAFSDKGPEKCSGLAVNRQTAESIRNTFGNSFELLESHTEDHMTPMGKTQNYIFAVLRKS